MQQLIRRVDSRVGHFPPFLNVNYTGCPRKSGTADFQYITSCNCYIFFTSLDKASSAEENDT